MTAGYDLIKGFGQGGFMILEMRTFGAAQRNGIFRDTVRVVMCAAAILTGFLTIPSSAQTSSEELDLIYLKLQNVGEFKFHEIRFDKEIIAGAYIPEGQSEANHSDILSYAIVSREQLNERGEKLANTILQNQIAQCENCLGSIGKTESQPFMTWATVSFDDPDGEINLQPNWSENLWLSTNRGVYWVSRKWLSQPSPEQRLLWKEILQSHQTCPPKRLGISCDVPANYTLLLWE